MTDMTNASPCPRNSYVGLEIKAPLSSDIIFLFNWNCHKRIKLSELLHSFPNIYLEVELERTEEHAGKAQRPIPWTVLKCLVV